MKEREEQQNQGVEIKEQMSVGYVPLSDYSLEESIFLSDPEKLNRWNEYVKESFFEQFGVDIETEFVRMGQGFQMCLKPKELPEGVEFETLRLFKIMKDDDVHDGHYYVLYDTKGIDTLDDVYADALWRGAQGLECEYDVKNPFTGKFARRNKTGLQREMRHHLKTKGGSNGWEVMIPVSDMKPKKYLEVFENPSDVSVENVCRELVRKAGKYVIDQLKSQEE